MFAASSSDALVMGLRVGAGGLSLVASLIVLGTICKLRKWKSVAQRLVLVLMLNAFFSALGDIMTIEAYRNDEVCFWQGVALQWTEMASFMWTSVIAFNLFVVVVLEIRDTSNLELWYHVFVWPLCCGLATFPLLTDNYGPASIWCWITPDYIGNIWRFLCFYVPLYIFLAFVVIMYLAIFVKVKLVFGKTNASKSEAQKKSDAKVLRTLLAYPLIFLAIWIIPTINRIVNWVDNETILAFLCVHAVLVAGAGFCNSIAYGFDRHTRRIYWNWISKIFCCFCKIHSHYSSKRYFSSRGAENANSNARKRLLDI